MKSARALLAAILLLAPTRLAAGAAMEQVGNESLRGYQNWPGIMPLVNHKSRVYQIWINGGESFYYRGNTRALNSALKSFAAVRSNQLIVILRPGQPNAATLSGVSIAYDWRLHVDAGIAAAFGGAPPTLTVYVGGNVHLDEVVMPLGLTLVGPVQLREGYRRDLDSANQRVVTQAIRNLVELEPDNPDNVPVLVELLSRDDAGVVLAAAHDLSSMGSLAISALPQLENVRDRHTSLNREAIERAIQRIRDANLGPRTGLGWHELSQQIDDFIRRVQAAQSSGTAATSRPATQGYR